MARQFAESFYTLRFGKYVLFIFFVSHIFESQFLIGGVLRLTIRLIQNRANFILRSSNLRNTVVFFFLLIIYQTPNKYNGCKAYSSASSTKVNKSKTKRIVRLKSRVALGVLREQHLRPHNRSFDLVAVLITRRINTVFLRCAKGPSLTR